MLLNEHTEMYQCPLLTRSLHLPLILHPHISVGNTSEGGVFLNPHPPSLTPILSRHGGSQAAKVTTHMKTPKLKRLESKPAAAPKLDTVNPKKSAATCVKAVANKANTTNLADTTLPTTSHSRVSEEPAEEARQFTIGSISTCTPTSDLHIVFENPYVYVFIT